MVMPAPAPDVSTSRFSAAGFSFQPAAVEDAATLSGFGSTPGTHYLCFGSDAYLHGAGARPDGGSRETIAEVVAKTHDGAIAGVARLALPPEDGGLPELTVAVQAAYERLGLLAPLLAAIVAEARRRGVERITTCVECHRCNPAEDLSEAGLRAVSWLGAGGVTELVLAIEQAG